jgi:pyruvate kinase
MATRTNITALSDQLELIADLAKSLELRFEDELARVHPDYHASARNLIAYLALRHVDIRDLQEQLALLGLSSLGRAEKNVMASIRTVQKALRKMSTGQDYDLLEEHRSFEQSKRMLDAHIEHVLGRRTDGRDVRIMVTMPTEAADDYKLVHDMIMSGMDMARVNCAHDDEILWMGMIDNINRAKAETGRSCRIMMDLAGPKLRTGDLLPGPGVICIRPKRDSLGRVIAPKRVRFVAEGDKWPLMKNPVIPVPGECITYAEIGDVVRLTDTRGKKRKLTVIGMDESGLQLECHKTTYLATGTMFRLQRMESGESIKFRVGRLPPVDEPIVLNIRDTLILHRDAAPGEPAIVDADGAVIKPAHISCRQPEVFGLVAAGDPIHLNDGKIEGIVESASDEELIITITHAKELGSRLRGNRGINIPNSDIQFRGLTDADRNNLSFIVRHADAVSLSFISKPGDIVALQNELRTYPSHKLGIIIKVETVKGFNNLPKLLLAAMRHHPAGIMIARGDLAVECGWERLAEIQEEMLWMCEAAQLPVIWATQVLERETKHGRPSRAEITDAAMSQRADCVMLNKGRHILAAIEMLDNILRRMQNHQHKKTPILRKLSITEV